MYRNSEREMCDMLVGKGGWHQGKPFDRDQHQVLAQVTTQLLEAKEGLAQNLGRSAEATIQNSMSNKIKQRKHTYMKKNVQRIKMFLSLAREMDDVFSVWTIFIANIPRFMYQNSKKLITNPLFI